jgi:hypothetical protein
MNTKELCYLLCLGVISFASGSAAAASETRDVAVLYRTRNVALTDNFYTTDPALRDGSISCCGYQNVGPMAYVFKSDLPTINGLLEFSKFYKGVPSTDHFYTISASEKSFVLAQGFIYEGGEGALFSSNQDGLAAIHRLNRFVASSQDLEHFYTTNSSEVSAYQQQGYYYDGVAGYAFAFRTSVAQPGLGFHGTSAFVTIPSAVDLRGPSTLPSEGACGGVLTTEIDGVRYTVPGSSFSYGLMPPTFTSRGCWTYLFGALISPGSHTLKQTHSGFAVKFSSGSYSYWKLVPSSQRTGSFSKQINNGKTGIIFGETSYEDAPEISDSGLTKEAAEVKFSENM